MEWVHQILVNSKMYRMWSVCKLLLGVCLWLVFMASHGSKADDVEYGTVLVNGTEAIGRTDDDFICATMDWWPPDKCDYGTCSWGNASLLNLDLNNPILLNAVKAFSPLKLRLGGTLQDKLTYQNIGNGQPCTQFTASRTELFGFTQGCLPMSRWDELNNFFNNTGAKVVFGLNALRGKTLGPGKVAAGPWDSSNAEALIRYTASTGYTIHGWELGNELSGNGIGARIEADQYALDMITLQQLIQTIYNGFQDKPLVIGPGGFFDKDWFTEFIQNTNNSIQVTTHHIYNLGAGVDDHLVERILNPDYLESGSGPFRDLQNILDKPGVTTVAWVGEAGGAYNSGHNLVSNAFVNSFWYLDQLGMSSSYDTKAYCRQTFTGGNYGLLQTGTFIPNPDYYSALLWHRLMGRNVLTTHFTGTKSLRAYSHCSKISQGITLLLINLSSDTKVQVSLSTDDDTGIKPSKMPEANEIQRTNLTPISSLPGNDGNVMRQEYHLTPENGDIHSQRVLLNGNLLTVNSSWLIPRLEPVLEAKMSEPITVAPFSIVFVHIPSIHFPACTSS